MKTLKSHFRFTKQERSGIFFLLLLLLLVQVGYYAYKNHIAHYSKGNLEVDGETQAQINELKQRSAVKDTVKIYPFNPNFITDYKGYTLGLSIDEIDRLHAFRATNTFVNSAKEFQEVTLVSDSLLAVLSPYFKFPEWVNNRANPSEARQNRLAAKKVALEVLDLNTATAEDLMLVNGIGETLAGRIVKFRDRLGGFLIEEQLADVYGLRPEVVERVLLQFKVLTVPQIDKIALNSATAEELAALVYIQKKVAYDIIAYRNRNGGIRSFDELLEIEGFPADRINRIALYLSLKK